MITIDEILNHKEHDMDKNLNEVINFCKEIFMRSEFKDNQGHLDHISRNIELSGKVLKGSFPNLSSFINMVMGKIPNTPNMKTMFFPQRFINKNVNDELLYEVETIVIDSFMIGYVYHFLFMVFPTRENIENVDFEDLFYEWLPKTIIADIEMRSYIINQQGLPNDYFETYYTKSKFDDYFKNVIKIGYFKRLKIKNYMKNIMCCGLYYGMLYDMATRQH